MSFISYAQNQEDVMLWRALKHVDQGLYIDIGAQDPVIDSVSLAFYERGWRGIHIEPTQQYADKLREARADETVLQAAVGNSDRKLRFFEFKDTGLSTGNERIARLHQKAGFEGIQTEVDLIALDTVLEMAGERAIHWLKLDVEGMEAEVLRSWVNATNRPWILVIESTKPLTQEESHGDWEEQVLSKGYQFVYTDGINRFYLSGNHSHLSEAFRYPPNYFDTFITYNYHQALIRADKAEKRAEIAQIRALTAETKAKRADDAAEHSISRAQLAVAQSEAVKQELTAVLGSASWRITWPLRWIWDGGMRIRAGSRRWLSEGIGSMPLLSRLSRLSTKLSSRPKRTHEEIQNSLAPKQGFRELTPRAKHIYNQLVTAVGNKQL